MERAAEQRTLRLTLTSPPTALRSIVAGASFFSLPRAIRRDGPTGSLYQEVVLFELGALHLFAHPHRRHAPAGPLQRFVLFGLIFRLWLRAFAGSAVAGGDGLNRRRRLLRHVATELRQLAFEIGALLTDLPGQHALQVVDVCAELSDIHGRDRLGGAFLVL